MKRLAGSGRVAWTVVALTAVGGCTAILGIDPEYHLVGDGGAGGAMSAAVTSTVAAGTTASSAAATTSGAGASGAATSSTGAGGICAPLTDKRRAGNLPPRISTRSR